MFVDKQLTTHNCDYALQVRADSNLLSIVAEDLNSMKRWTAEFPAQYVEDLTHKTGNFKRFSVFTKMLATALEDRSSAVSVDLLSYGDLEMLKSGRRVSGTSDAGKKYLILTYIGEFDKVHYPLPLSQEELNDPRELRALVSKLRQEVETLRRGLPKDRQDHYHLWQENVTLREQLAHTKRHADPGQIEELKRTVLELEDELAFTKKSLNKELRSLKIQRQEAQAEADGASMKLEEIVAQFETDAGEARDRSRQVAKENEALRTEVKAAREDIARRKKETESYKAELHKANDNERRLRHRVESLEAELQGLMNKPSTDLMRSRSFTVESPFKRTPVKSPGKSDKSSNKSSPGFSSPSQASKYAKSLMKKFGHKEERASASGRIADQISKVSALISRTKA
jgi:coiled-coil domain-containing protein 61